MNHPGYGVDVGRGVVIFHRPGTGENGRLERFIIAINFLNDRVDTVTDFRRPNYRLESHWGRVWFQ